MALVAVHTAKTTAPSVLAIIVLGLVDETNSAGNAGFCLYRNISNGGMSSMAGSYVLRGTGMANSLTTKNAEILEFCSHYPVDGGMAARRAIAASPRSARLVSEREIDGHSVRSRATDVFPPRGGGHHAVYAGSLVSEIGPRESSRLLCVVN